MSTPPSIALKRNPTSPIAEYPNSLNPMSACSISDDPTIIAAIIIASTSSFTIRVNMLFKLSSSFDASDSFICPSSLTMFSKFYIFWTEFV